LIHKIAVKTGYR